MLRPKETLLAEFKADTEALDQNSDETDRLISHFVGLLFEVVVDFRDLLAYKLGVLILPEYTETHKPSDA